MGSQSYLDIPCGISAGVILDAEHVADVAKEVVLSSPLICNWGQCHVQLNSWKTLQEHLHQHCKHLEPSSSQPGVMECMSARCSGRFHHAVHDLQQHIDLSHLSRILLPCPIQDCPHTFSRNLHDALSEHLWSSHRDLLGRRLPQGGSILRPLRAPHPHVPENLPPLPAVSIPAFIFATPEVRRARPLRGKTPTGSQGARKRWKRMHAVHVVDEDDSPSIPLADLPPLDPHQLPESSVTVQRKAHQPALQQSRPQHMVVPPVPEPMPPVSIGYEAFAARFEELEKVGMVDRKGPWPRGKKGEESKKGPAAAL